MFRCEFRTVRVPKLPGLEELDEVVGAVWQQAGIHRGGRKYLTERCSCSREVTRRHCNVTQLESANGFKERCVCLKMAQERFDGSCAMIEVREPDCFGVR